MTANRHHSPPPNPASSPSEVRNTAVRSTTAWWILGASVLALLATIALMLAGDPGNWIGAIWLVAVLWTIAATLVQALWAGIRHGDWSAFSGGALPRDDDGHDFSMRSGRYAFLRIRDEHEALMREGDR